ncbi:hypothetical protein RUM43_000443 [Polyplax serrata]|uniref:AFP-like domain-containing protein n=1 Tax=Polyplax serrata TaxID=468196 RepID=A0AAN8SFZ1_POLSC
MAEQVKKPKPIKLGQKYAIGPDERCFIIAEIGQNHQGDINLAKEMITVAKTCGADCVKFQKSHLPSKFNKGALLRSYDGPNSWGKTYGDHKRFLEFNEPEFIEIQKFAEQQDILFSTSVMDNVSLLFVNSLNVPFIKIGSGDTHNRQLLKHAAQLGKPLIISTGMSNSSEIIDLYNFLQPFGTEFCFLHCVSSYPLPPKDVNLNVIRHYKEIFPDINIGYSGHELGIDIPLAAVALGAKIIEKHFTLDKSLKGTDHICSLNPDEFKNMVSSIRRYENNEITIKSIMNKESVQTALGEPEKKFQESEKACYKKLGKTIVAAVELQPGDILTWDNICLKVSEPQGIAGKYLDSLLGKTINRKVQEDESIFPEYLE